MDTTRRRFMLGCAAIALIPALPVNAKEIWHWHERHIAMLDEAIDNWSGPFPDLGGVPHYSYTDRYSAFGQYPNIEDDLRPGPRAKMKRA